MVNAEDLARDGLEPMGSVAVGATMVLCDPSDVTGGTRRQMKPGEWSLFVRPDPDDDEVIIEAILVHPGAIAGFWERYDEAVAAGEIVVARKRLAFVDVRQAGDTALRAAMFEPDELPWLFEGGAVLATRPDGRVQVFFSGQPAILASLVFGPPADVIPGTISVDDE
jgi:hypothetical protein